MSKISKPRFSIIIPVYNVEKYLEKCLNSVEGQYYQNYEVIIICDKCDDKSEDIVDCFAKKHSNFHKIFAENTGLSLARNIGVKHATGDYILFLDSDDYYELNLLEVLNNSLDDDPEVVRFQIAEDCKGTITRYLEKGFKLTDGLSAFNTIYNYHFIENAWSYCYKRTFWNDNKFSFKEKCIAEDYGLIPLILATSKKVKSLNVIGYNYVQRNNSLMNNNNYQQKLKKMDDMLFQAREIKKNLSNKQDSELVITFLNKSLIYYATTLSKNDYKKYKKILQKENCFKLKGLSYKQKIKNIIISCIPYIYYNKVVNK